jgi:hypothetical protein
MHENRETSGAPRPERERGRSAKAQSHTADAHALEESDRTILSMNQTNKEERSSEETGEKRVRAKENIVLSNTSPTQCGEVSVPRIVRCASSSIARQSSKVGAVCGSAARTVLCGGRSVMIVPTATSAGINRYVAGNERVLQERSQRLHLGPQSCRRHREMTPEA